MGTTQAHRTIASVLLADARHRAGLTQEQVAGRAGVARPSISQYENGRKDPSVTTLNRLIEACGMELHLRADPLGEADRAQASRDAEVGTVDARRNSQRARAGLVQLRRLMPIEPDEANHQSDGPAGLTPASS
jgi:transcriptional regulator with XRE-family HTH domain